MAGSNLILHRLFPRHRTPSSAMCHGVKTMCNWRLVTLQRMNCLSHSEARPVTHLETRTQCMNSPSSTSYVQVQCVPKSETIFPERCSAPEHLPSSQSIRLSFVPKSSVCAMPAPTVMERHSNLFCSARTLDRNCCHIGLAFVPESLSLDAHKSLKNHSNFSFSSRKLHCLSQDTEPRFVPDSTLCKCTLHAAKSRGTLSGRKSTWSSFSKFGLRCVPFELEQLGNHHCWIRRRHYGSVTKAETGDPLSPSSVQFKCYIDHLRQEHDTISKSLQGGEHLSDSKQKAARKRLVELADIIDKWEELQTALQEIDDLEGIIQGKAESTQDKEMQELAVAEKEDLVSSIADIKEELIELMIPSEETDDNDVIMEFSAGVGGQEAMLFAADMFDMYQRYAAFRGWKFEVLEYLTTDLGGLRHASVSISGDQAYRLMRYEAGVHRVQRVPKTEKQGRIHTSTMAIAVLPQPKEIDLNLDPKDLRIETKKASGAGGQHVNTTDSAVRITHMPTGISAESQQERSQHKNRIIAMTMLQTRIYNQILDEQTSSERSLRRSQVGSAGRSEKIRTYNYQQDRVTDHRASRTVHDVPDYLDGGALLDDMVLSIMEWDDEEGLKARIQEVYESSLKTPPGKS